MNPIQELLQSEIISLLDKSDGFEAIQHNPTKGTLRENLLINFFRKIIPQKLSINSGIICDAKGNSSTQIDFIVFDNTYLPNIVLSNSIVMTPVESVYLIAEIKSTLRKRDLDQISNARKKMNSLELAFTGNNEMKVPSTILAFKSSVSKESLKDWLNENGDVVSICVIGHYTISKEKGGIKIYDNSSNVPEYWETLNFSTQMFNYLLEEMKSRDSIPLWGAYLLGADNFAKKHNLKLKKDG
jgi:hypothetical protein